MRSSGATLVLLAAGCAGLGGSPPASSSSKADTSAVSTPVSSAAAVERPPVTLDPAKTHCSPEQLAWLHCQLEGHQQLSVCTSNPISADASLQVLVGTKGQTQGFPGAPAKRGSGWRWSLEDRPFTGPAGPPAMLIATVTGDGWAVTEDALGVRWTEGKRTVECASTRGELANLADYFESP